MRRRGRSPSVATMTRVERFEQHFNQLAGKTADNIYANDLPDGGRISELVYRDVPEPGMLIGVSYGLSLTDHPAWQYGRPELMIAVRSDDDRWARAVGLLAANLAGQCPFSYGDVLNFGQPVSEDSQMTHFVVFAPTLLEREDYLNVLGAREDLGPQEVINIQGVYPIHASEADAIGEGRLEELWKSGWDPYDVRRPPAL